MNARLMSRILFATDFSYCATRAEEYATSLAIAWDAGMDLLHVLKGSAGIPSGSADISPPEQMHEDVTPQLDEMQKQIARKGVAATVHQVRGIPSEQINQTAKERGIDLVVMGTEGRTGRDSRLLGSTAERVTKTAPCPVLAVPSLREGAVGTSRLSNPLSSFTIS